MRHDFYLAWQYLRHYRWRSLTLLVCVSLIGILPLLLNEVLTQGERLMLQRAKTTPWLIGARGSTADTTLAALYFRDTAPPVAYGEINRVEQSGWATALPIHARYRIHQIPLLGITADYFDFRHLVPALGDLPGFIGDCVLGARAARRLGLGVGDKLVSTPDNFFDLAGLVPLKLHITGVLAATDTVDDEAVYVDLKTVWIMEGLGHGHDSATTRAAPTGSAFTTPETDPASAGAADAVEITPDNLDAFHFHGDMERYPVTAIIVAPHDDRAATLLGGRYVDENLPVRLIQPVEVIHHLMHNIFRISTLFNLVLAGASGAALLALMLVFALSLQLRRGELDTIELLGCDHLTVVRLVMAEILLILLLAAGLGSIFLAFIRHESGILAPVLLDAL